LKTSSASTLGVKFPVSTPWYGQPDQRLGDRLVAQNQDFSLG
jgi:hypothetical protein